MAQSISDEELQLKKRARRRLVGAIAMVLLAVIFLPMVLDKEPKPVGQDIAIRIPSQENTPFHPQTAVPASVPKPVQAAPAEPPKPAEKDEPKEAAFRERRLRKLADVFEDQGASAPPRKVPRLS